MALRLVNVVPEAASTVYRRLVVAKGREGIARRMRRQSFVFELHPLRQATIWWGRDGAPPHFHNGIFNRLSTLQSKMYSARR